ncbi:MAG: Trk system potassium transporter TrkA [Nitrospirota bacterium]|nr:Trk system potassium transporter TrkA [Nitrospirota bacterium]
MRIIIVGAGEVGFQIAKILALEVVDVVVIDKDKANLKKISEELDVAVIEGEGGSPSSLKDAGADNADILLAVTNSDETNMIACLLAKAMFNIPRKIARIRNPEYFHNEKLLSAGNLDINPAINPELEVAKAVIRLLEIPFATDVEDFEGGLIKMIGFKVQEDTPITGKTMKELGSSLTKKFLLGIIDKGDRTIIPSGDDIINKDDIIYFPVKKWEVADALALLGISAKPPKRIMLLGGGRIGYYIASAMELKTDVKIIERDPERCKFLSRKLKKSLVLHGDGADQQLLVEEYISDMDIFVAVSNNEELNIMASLLAKKLGVQKTIAIVNRMDYIPLAHSLGLQAVLSPRLITASSILRYVRRGDILALTTIAKGNVEVIEARVGKTSQLAGKSLKNANLPKASLIGTIIRDDKIIIPSGDDTIKVDDKLIIFTLRESIKKIEKILIG